MFDGALEHGSRLQLLTGEPGICWHTGRLQEGAQRLAESVRIADGFQLGSLTALFQQDPRVTSRSFLSAIQGLRGAGTRRSG